MWDKKGWEPLLKQLFWVRIHYTLTTFFSIFWRLVKCKHLSTLCGCVFLQNKGDWPSFKKEITWGKPDQRLWQMAKWSVDKKCYNLSMWLWDLCFNFGIYMNRIVKTKTMMKRMSLQKMVCRNIAYFFMSPTCSHFRFLPNRICTIQEAHTPSGKGKLVS